MELLVPVAVAVYVLVGVGTAVWSHLRGHHRPEASTVARVASSIMVGLAWPAMAPDLWLADPDDTRRRRRRGQDRPEG